MASLQMEEDTQGLSGKEEAWEKGEVLSKCQEEQPFWKSGFCF